jgi:TrmH family RNA methyltransferase
MLSKNQIKEIQSLQLKKFRDARKLFIAEGIKTVREIIAQHPEILKEIFATQDFIQAHKNEIRNLPITEITETELKKISLQTTPNHVLAVCQYFQDSQADINLEKNFSLFLDDVRDPGNFGTIVRLAGWFGINTIFCSTGSCDFYNPKVIQSTMGAFLRVNVIYTNLKDLIASFPGIPVYGAVLNGTNLYNEKLGNGLIVIGNEANGINDENMKLVTKPVTIPGNRDNNTESLNAAIATSIIVSEFFRQTRM